MYYNTHVRDCQFVLVFGLFVPRALATDIASCQAGWEWAYNSNQQNPCELTILLEAACRNTTLFTLLPLEQGENYPTPQRNDSAQKCDCNTVMFSLYMACTACQNVSTETWSFWRQNCDTVYVTQYPEDIPSNAPVPKWAYLDYTVGDRFDPVAAKAAGDQPESPSTVPATVSLPDSPTVPGSQPSTSTSPTSAPTDPSQQNSNQDRNSSKVVAIAVALSCLAFLTVAGSGVWIFLRMRKKSRRDITEDHPGGLRYPGGALVFGHDSRLKMKLYDPSDPSTFPGQIVYGTSESGATLSNKPHYAGAAEL